MLWIWTAAVYTMTKFIIVNKIYAIQKQTSKIIKIVTVRSNGEKKFWILVKNVYVAKFTICCYWSWIFDHKFFEMIFRVRLGVHTCVIDGLMWKIFSLIGLKFLYFVFLKHSITKIYILSKKYIKIHRIW